jgi:hypothetical protein
MKKLFLVSLLAIAFNVSFGQSLIEISPENAPSIIESMFPDGKYKQFEIITEVPGKSKNEIYLGLKSWYAKTFNNPKEVIQSDVPGEIIQGVGKTIRDSYIYDFEITTMIKDGKYKTSITPRKITSVTGKTQIQFPPLEKCYADWKEKKAGVFSTTGAMSNKVFVMVDLVYGTHKGFVDGINKEVNSYASF